MCTIHLTTFIAAPIERVFDLSRSISLHKISSAHTNKEAIGGITSGLINKNETVTWRAKHLFKIRYFTTRISEMQSPKFFNDEISYVTYINRLLNSDLQYFFKFVYKKN